MESNIFNIQYFLPVLVRISGLFVFVPFFNGKSIPIVAKVGASLLLSFLIFSVRSWQGQLPTSALGYTCVLLKECLVGFAMGILLAVLFSAVQASGEIIGYQIGFSLVSSYDPNFGQLEIIGQLESMLVMTLFLLLDGHHKLIEVMVRSYDLIPIGQASFTPALAEKLLASMGLIFGLAYKIGAPIIITLWMTSVCLAILNRVIPQMNIFMVDFPIRIGIGFASLALCLPFIAHRFGFMLQDCWRDIVITLHMMKG